MSNISSINTGFSNTSDMDCISDDDFSLNCVQNMNYILNYYTDDDINDTDDDNIRDNINRNDANSNSLYDFTPVRFTDDNSAFEIEPVRFITYDEITFDNDNGNNDDIIASIEFMNHDIDGSNNDNTGYSNTDSNTDSSTDSSTSDTDSSSISDTDSSTDSDIDSTTDIDSKNGDIIIPAFDDEALLMIEESHYEPISPSDFFVRHVFEILSNGIPFTFHSIQKICGLPVKVIIFVDKDRNFTNNTAFSGVYYIITTRIAGYIDESKLIVRNLYISKSYSVRTVDALILLRTCISDLYSKLPNFTICTISGVFILPNEPIIDEGTQNKFIDAEPCCVCLEKTSIQTTCDHHLCILCWNNIQKKHKQIKCPICRNEVMYSYPSEHSLRLPFYYYQF